MSLTTSIQPEKCPKFKKVSHNEIKEPAQKTAAAVAFERVFVNIGGREPAAAASFCYHGISRYSPKIAFAIVK